MKRPEKDSPEILHGSPGACHAINGRGNKGLIYLIRVDRLYASATARNTYLNWCPAGSFRPCRNRMKSLAHCHLFSTAARPVRWMSSKQRTHVHVTRNPTHTHGIHVALGCANVKYVGRDFLFGQRLSNSLPAFEAKTGTAETSRYHDYNSLISQLIW